MSVQIICLGYIRGIFVFSGSFGTYSPSIPILLNLPTILQTTTANCSTGDRSTTENLQTRAVSNKHRFPWFSKLIPIPRKCHYSLGKPGLWLYSTPYFSPPLPVLFLYRTRNGIREVNVGQELNSCSIAHSASAKPCMTMTSGTEILLNISSFFPSITFFPR